MWALLTYLNKEARGRTSICHYIQMCQKTVYHMLMVGIKQNMLNMKSYVIKHQKQSSNTIMLTQYS